jgi:hypothetical protein
MKLHTVLGAVLLSAFLFSPGIFTKNAPSAAPSPAPAVEAFLGRWDLTVQTPQRDYPSWIEIRQENGQLAAQMVGREGSARPLPKVEIQDDQLTFVSPKQAEHRAGDMVFEGKLIGGVLSGTTTGPDGTPWVWTGRRAPALRRTATPQWGTPIPLFNGTNLSGWRSSDPAHADNWRVENGLLVTKGKGAEIITFSTFDDFKLHVEFRCGEKANSGVYLRGRYEIQIETDSAQNPPSHHTGAVYGFIPPSPEQPRVPGKWQAFDITLLGRILTVVHNGQTVIASQEIPGITGGAVDSHEGLPGPIYLQGSEEGRIEFRNLVITPAKEQPAEISALLRP